MHFIFLDYFINLGSLFFSLWFGLISHYMSFWINVYTFWTKVYGLCTQKLKGLNSMSRPREMSKQERQRFFRRSLGLLNYETVTCEWLKTSSGRMFLCLIKENNTRTLNRWVYELLWTKLLLSFGLRCLLKGTVTQKWKFADMFVSSSGL